MKEETIKNLFEKYKNGETSIKEEKFLFNNVDENQPEIKILADFVAKNQLKTFDNLNGTLWESFNEKTTKKNRFKIGFLSAAASIALIFTLFIYNSNKNTLTETEKQALLNEAKNMFIEADEEKGIYRKILENELVIVYTKTQ